MQAAGSKRPAQPDQRTDHAHLRQKGAKCSLFGVWKQRKAAVTTISTMFNEPSCIISVVMQTEVPKAKQF
jgi:hypothetical protein